LAGNSWLTQCQWFIGAEQPPHLTCLCPWEGWNDLYNDNLNRGGVPDPGFQDSLLRQSYAGRGKTEDVAYMSRERNSWNDYWESRKAKLERITVPMYIVASWTNFLHTRGTFRGYIESSACKDKWLRVHNSQEWPGEQLHIS
jgi:predicted acyl esterase